MNEQYKTRMGLDDYFNLRKSFVFYGAYHKETRNKWIHILFVPTIFTTALHFASKLPLCNCANAPSGVVTLADVAAVFYAVSFIKMEVGAGLMYAPLIYGMHHIANNALKGHTEVAIGLHVLGWVCQFIGHGLFERRAPALFDNLFQALHAAVFFVWLEVLFALGYKPELHKELQQQVDKAIAGFKSKEKKN